MNPLSTIIKQNELAAIEAEPKDPIDITSLMVDFEMGEITEEDMILLFQDLVDTGLAWQLQGIYGHIATRMIESGIITTKL